MSELENQEKLRTLAQAIEELIENAYPGATLELVAFSTDNASAILVNSGAISPIMLGETMGKVFKQQAIGDSPLERAMAAMMTLRAFAEAIGINTKNMPLKMAIEPIPTTKH